MDVRTLKVGQDIFVVSGCYYADGKVVEITQSGVKIHLPKNPLPGENNVVWQFDPKGEALNGIGTAEYGPFTIDDMPFVARRAELAELALKRELLHKKYPNGCVIPANEPLPPIF